MKIFKKLAVLVALVLTCSLGLIACEEPHEHSYDYAFDGNAHWQICTDEGCEYKGENAAHTFTESNGYSQGAYCKFETCDTCSYVKKTVIVEAVEATNAVVGGAGVTAVKESKVDSTDFAIGTPFSQVIAKLNERCANKAQPATIKTTIAGSEKMGIALTGNIKLTENITVGYNNNTTTCLHIIGNTVIDLNGFTISQRGAECGAAGLSGYALFILREGATLTIIDSSATQTGCINGVMTAIQTNANSTLNIYGGTIKCAQPMTAHDADEENFCVYTVATNGGTVNVYGGTITTVATRPIINSTEICEHTDYNFALATYGAGTYNIYGGTISGTVDSDITSLNDYRN
ncbi:MAG: hypothetical protein IJY57_03000 [Clostridia bacterium]|nr:hypothetical protein [Clostridia bacterium]